MVPPLPLLDSDVPPYPCHGTLVLPSSKKIGGGLVSSFGNFAVKFLCATTSDGIGEEGDECDDANGGER